jgi:hypothetical protein
VMRREVNPSRRIPSRRPPVNPNPKSQGAVAPPWIPTTNAGARKSSGFDKRFNELMSFKAKYGHCDVLRTGDNASLGSWCSEMRASHRKLQHNQKPRMKLSDEQIQHLNDAGFKWSLR